MKKSIYIFIIILLLSVGIPNVYGVVVTERKINRPVQMQQTTNLKTPAVSNSVPTTTKRSLSESLKTCRPYTETMKSDYMGLTINYRLDIVGWVKDKCRLDFQAETSGVNSSFETIYGIDPSEANVASFVPKIRCEFTQQQLAEVGDSVLEEEARSSGATKHMLKDPNSIDFNGFANMSGNDAKLASILLGGKTCRILNNNDLTKMMQSIMGY